MKKVFWPIVAVAMIVVGVVAVACSKDSEKSVPAQESSVALSPKSEEKVIIGKLHEGRPICGVDEEEFSKALWEETGIYVAEKFEILDSFPNLMNGYAEIHMVLFNVESETPEFFWIEIEKEDGSYVYTCKGSDRGQKTRCSREANNPCTKDCFRKYDGYGRFLGCECTGEKSCKEESIPNEFMDTLLKILTISISIHFII